MRLFSIIACYLALFAAVPSLVTAQSRRVNDFAIVGYLPDYRLAEIDVNATRYLTDLIYFSIEPNADGSLNTEKCGPEALKKLKTLRSSFKGRLLIALGGWERSSGFAPVATDAAKCNTFAHNLVQFCKTNGFDGVDFDWEHPKGEAEVKAYGELVAATKRAFKPQKLFISATLAQANHMNQAGFDAADRIQVMSYDHSGRHSTFQQMQADVESFLKAGVTKSKLCPGLPFYGRSLKDWDQALTYADIIAKYKPQPQDDEAGDFYFNEIKTVQEKVRFCREKTLRGIMVWEIAQNTRDASSLLRAIYQEASSAAPQNSKRENNR